MTKENQNKPINNKQTLTMNNSNKLLLGVLAGAAAGAFIGMMLAPQKGSVTRDQLAHLGDDYAGDITDKIRELRESITEKIESLKHNGDNVVTDTVNEIDTAVSKVANTGLGGTRSGSTGGSGSPGSSGSNGGWSPSGSQTL
jgi:gas vesicle protein